MKDLIFTSQSGAIPSIITYTQRIPEELKAEIEKKIKEKHGENADYEIGDITVRVFKH